MRRIVTMLHAVKDEARRALAALFVAIAGVAAVFAGVAGSGHPAWLTACIVIAIAAGAVAVGLEVPDMRALVGGRLRMPRPRRPSRLEAPPAPDLPLPVPVTDRWQYTSDGDKARAAMHTFEFALPGTGYMMQPGDRPAWIRFVVVMPCSEIGPNAEAARLYSEFQMFLKDQPVISLVNSLTRPVAGMKWTRWATNSAAVIDAVFTPGSEKEAAASARLELPDGTSRYFRDEHCAVLILHFEASALSDSALPQVGPVAWTDHVLRGLELPQALTRLLSRLGLTTAAEPAVVLGVRLDAQRDLAELIDVTDLHELPGSQHKSVAIAYFIRGSPECVNTLLW
jgi:hypothetical protein